MLTSAQLCPTVPPTPMSVEQARTAMQEHLRCVTATCATRRQAIAELVRAGQMKLSGR